MEVHPDWREFLSLLSSHRVKYLLVGAHALAIHGTPRYTGDLEVWVEPTPANAKRLHRALVEFGFGSVSGLSVADFARPGQVIMLGTPPVRIDVLTSISGVTFATAWKHRLRVKYADKMVNALGFADLVKNKRAAGRTKDLLDLELLAPPRR